MPILANCLRTLPAAARLASSMLGTVHENGSMKALPLALPQAYASSQGHGTTNSAIMGPLPALQKSIWQRHSS